MKYYSDFSNADLKAELARREARDLLIPPELIENPDFSRIIKLCQDHIKEIADRSFYDDSDLKHYLYEEVMTALYGEKFWEWKRGMV